MPDFICGSLSGYLGKGQNIPGHAGRCILAILVEIPFRALFGHGAAGIVKKHISMKK